MLDLHTKEFASKAFTLDSAFTLSGQKLRKKYISDRCVWRHWHFKTVFKAKKWH